jgi:hypothetical protein
MNLQEELSKFQEDFFSYGKLISTWSDYGIDLLKRIDQKSEEFNKLSEDQRIQYMNADPDFQQLQETIRKLNLYYISFYNFMNEGLINPDQSEK